MIRVQNLSKQYGDRRAVDGISFHIDEGEIVGFLGPNGAGKLVFAESLALSKRLFPVDDLRLWGTGRDISKGIGRFEFSNIGQRCDLSEKLSNGLKIFTPHPIGACSESLNFCFE